MSAQNANAALLLLSVWGKKVNKRSFLEFVRKKHISRATTVTSCAVLSAVRSKGSGWTDQNIPIRQIQQMVPKGTELLFNKRVYFILLHRALHNFSFCLEFHLYSRQLLTLTLFRKTSDEQSSRITTPLSVGLSHKSRRGGEGFSSRGNGALVSPSARGP